MAEHSENRLTFWIVVAIVAAVVFAAVLPLVVETTGFDADYVLAPLDLGGKVFLRILTMIVVPLVVASVAAGILGLGDVRKLGRPGAYTVLYYLATTVLAVVLGLALVNVVRPGVGTISEEERERAAASSGAPEKKQLYGHLAAETGMSEDEVAQALGDEEYGDARNRSVATVLRNLVLMLFAENLVAAAANTDLLPLIAFSIVFAAVLTTLGDRASTLVRLVREGNDALMAFVLLVMRIAPLGIFCLVAARFGEATVSGELARELQKTGWYSATVLIGLGLHAFVTLPMILWFFTGRNPFVYMGRMSQAILTAFSTSSSSATLPITMECAIDKAGVSRKSVDFVLPLGATINMDGTALYEAVAAIFIAQVIGIDLSFPQQCVVAVTATLAAIGAAGIPQAGLVTMIIVLASVDLPVAYVTLILPVDWLLDRFRTAVNVFGDATGAAVVEKAFPDGEPATASASS